MDIYCFSWAHWSHSILPTFRFLLFLQGFHNWTLNPFHMMGVVAGILGGALLSAIHGATVINTLYQGARAYTTFRAFSPSQPEETDFYFYRAKRASACIRGCGPSFWCPIGLFYWTIRTRFSGK